MPRRILHHGDDPAASGELIGDRAIAGCWFEWHRQGGCGAAEVRLRDEFVDRDAIAVGDWLSIETEPGVRWYLGRVETRESTFPAGLRLHLAGMAVELGEVFPGGFGSDADGAPPQRFGATDRFTFDPDRDLETFDPLHDAVDVVRLLMTRYVVPRTHIAYVPALVEDGPRTCRLDSLKIRGEESVRSLMKDLAVRASGSAWGVDVDGEFFFLRRRTASSLTLRIGRDITALEEFTDRENLFNRVLLTGDYVYDQRDYSGVIARRSYRWRGNYVQPESRAAYGERRLRVWLPWIRTQADSLSFVREFFRTYSQPSRRYQVTTGDIGIPAFPWLGSVRIEDAAGNELMTGVADAIRVTFDRVPRFRLEIGPEDPRNLFPEPPHDERWELPDHRPGAGGNVSLTSFDVTSLGGGDSTSSGESATSASGDSSIPDDSEESAGSETSGSSDASDSSAASDASSPEDGPTSSKPASSDASEESSAAESSGSEDSITSEASESSMDSEGSDTSHASGSSETSMDSDTSAHSQSSLPDDSTTSTGYSGGSSEDSGPGESTSYGGTDSSFVSDESDTSYAMT